METSLLFMSVALLSGFVVVTSLVFLVSWSYQKQCVVLAAQGTDPNVRSLIRLHIESGIPCLAPLAQILLRQVRIAAWATKAVEILRGKGFRVSSLSSITLFIGILVAVFLGAFIFTFSVVAAVAVAACVAVVIVISIESAYDRLKNEFREDVPVVLELMTTCFGSGFTLLQTFQQIAQDIDGNLGKLFAQGAHILETGGSVSDALDLLREHTDTSELTFVVAALEVQHQNGGALSPVLSTAAESVKNELALKQTLRVQTAQAKLSARIVIVMPFVLIAFFSLVSPNFMAPFFSSIAGYALLAGALLMEIAGIMLVKRSLLIGGLS